MAIRTPRLVRAPRIASSLLSAVALLALPLAGQGHSTQLATGVLPPAEVHDASPPNVPQPPEALMPGTLREPRYPPVPIGVGTLPQPTSAPSTIASAGPGPLGGCALTTYQQVDLPSSRTLVHGLVGSPSVAQVGDTILQTGTWFAARSIDQGASWTHINPYTLFPSVDGGFEGSQRVLYIPSHDIVVWAMLYAPNAQTGSGGLRIAVANGRAGLRNGTSGNWHSFYFGPSNFFLPGGTWFDFPDIGYSDDYLYVTTNTFTGSRTYTDSVWMRLPLSGLSAGGSVPYVYKRSSAGMTGVSYRLAQNATDTCYLAVHLGTTQLRVYRIPDAGSSFTFSDFGVPAWARGPTVALAPNGVNWGARTQDRVLGGYQNATEYGFLWSSNPLAGRPKCFVRAARIRKSDNTLIATEDVYSLALDFLYPAATTNARGDTGCTFALASATQHPTTGWFVVDACIPTFHGQIYGSRSGQASPSVPDWGDYASLQRHPTLPQTFVGCGQRLLSSGAVTPFYTWFGRASEAPVPVTVDVQSGVSGGVPFTLDATDRLGRKDGTTSATRSFFPDQGYTLSVPPTMTVGGQSYVFHRWRLRSSPTGSYVDQPEGVLTLTVDSIGSTDDIAFASYARLHQLTVLSANPTSGITITTPAPGDQNGRTSTVTPGSFTFASTGIGTNPKTVTAPAMNGIHPFKQWILDGVPVFSLIPMITVPMTGPHVLTAEYSTRIVGGFQEYGFGCPGTNNDVPHHSASGTPNIDSSYFTRLDLALPNAAVVRFLSNSNTNWVGVPLPINLGFLGMGTCTLFAGGDVQTGLTTGGNGTIITNINIPNDPSLVDTHYYSQFVVFDPGTATPMQLVLSNAVDTLIGGVF